MVEGIVSAGRGFSSERWYRFGQEWRRVVGDWNSMVGHDFGA